MDDLTSSDYDLIWYQFREKLRAEVDAVPDLAAAYDQFRMPVRHWLAEQMFAELCCTLRQEAQFSNIDFNILSLTSPYFTRSEISTNVTLALADAFNPDNWKDRPFDELEAIAFGLIDLSFFNPDQPNLWEDFYDAYRRDPVHRIDAFDVAVAGLTMEGIDRFAKFMNSQPLEPWLLDRWDFYLPTLVSRYGRIKVGHELGQFLCKATKDAQSAERAAMLAQLADASGIPIEQVERSVNLSVPSELRVANAIVSTEREHFEFVDEVVTENTVTVITSDYAGSDLLLEYQASVFSFLESSLSGRLSNLEVNMKRTKTFAELPEEGSVDHKYIYAFPMFLTEAKKVQLHYSVCRLGKQRRLGVLIPRKHTLCTNKYKCTTLSQLLTLIPRVDAKIWCAANYAIHEIIRQAIRKVHNGSNSLSDRIQIVTGADTVMRNLRDDKKGVYVFDLAIQEQIQRFIRLRSKSDWLHDAEIRSISHDLEIPVGIGFNRFAVPLIIRYNLWAGMTSLVSEWVKKEDFAALLCRIGIDVEAEVSDLTKPTKGAFPVIHGGKR